MLRHLADRMVPERRLPGVCIVVVYCGLLLLVPSRLIVRQIGAAGTPANLWGTGALIYWASMKVGGFGRSPIRNPIHWVLGALTLCVCASYVAAMIQGWYVAADVRESTSDIFDLVPAGVELVRATSIDAADRGLISYAAWLGIALVACDSLRSWADLERVVNWLAIFAAIVAGIGLVQYFAGWNIASLFQIPGLVANQEFGAVDARSVVRRVYATAVHPIEFGVVLAAIFPLALHRALFRTQRRFAVAPALLLGLAVPISVSRSAILVLVVAIVVMFVGWPAAWRIRALILAPVAVGGIRALMPGVVGTIFAYFTHFGEDPSVAGRTNDYAIVLREASGQPILGQGLYTFIPRFYRILDNQYLVLLLELGIVGLVTAMVTLLVAFGCARGARRRESDDAHRHLALALSASIAGLALCYATFDAWSAPIAAGLSFLVIGLIGAAYRLARADRIDEEPSAGEGLDVAEVFVKTP